MVQIEINNEEKVDSLDWKYLKNSFDQDGVILTKNFFSKGKIDLLKKSLIEVKSGKYKSGLCPIRLSIKMIKIKIVGYFTRHVMFGKVTLKLKTFYYIRD